LRWPAAAQKTLKQLAEMIRGRPRLSLGRHLQGHEERVCDLTNRRSAAGYARFPITQGLCGAAWNRGNRRLFGDVRKIRDICLLPQHSFGDYRANDQ